ncbi:MAG: 4a-hydroxytetrahydrobiopterin dehydratase [Planctomycetota bacterium]
MSKLEPEAIDAALETLGDWSRSGDALQRTFGFDGFLEAMAFVSRVASMAEERQHHPDILIRYNKVTLTLSTHDAGGVTSKDLEMARALE